MKAALAWRVRVVLYQLGALVCLLRNHSWLVLGELNQSRRGFKTMRRVAAVCTRCGALGLR